MTPPASLGPRIAIFGPSNAGKSTLAVAMSKRLNIPAIHLDQLKFIPNTNWEMIDWILFKSPKNVAKYAAMIDTAGVPSITCQNTRELNRLYTDWNLPYPKGYFLRY
jgi:hypothetical protein